MDPGRIDWIGSDRIVSNRIGSDRIEWVGSDRIDWIGSDRIGSDRIGSGRIDWIGSDRIESHLIGSDGSDRIGSIGSDGIGSNRIGSDRGSWRVPDMHLDLLIYARRLQDASLFLPLVVYDPIRSNSRGQRGSAHASSSAAIVASFVCMKFSFIRS